MNRNAIRRRGSLINAKMLAMAAPALLLSWGAANAETAKVGPQKVTANATAEAGSGARVEEVVVTARKREESVQNVPIAISAVSAQLKMANIRDVQDIVAFTPNVRIDSNPQRGNAASITIRGVSPTRTDDNSIDSPIGVLIDGVYIGSLPGQIIQNFDLDRIEVLRGPQGTLFGRNTVGGAVSVIRTEPTGKWGVNLQYTTGSWNDQEFRGVVNGSIIEDKLAFKVFAIRETRDGFLYNTTLHNFQPQKDYGNYGVSLKFTPNDKFKAVITAERYIDRSQGGAFLTNYNFVPGVLPTPTNINDINASGGALECLFYAPGTCRTSLAIPKTISGNIPNPGRVDTYAVTANMSYKINDNLKLVSVTGYRKQHEEVSFDFDGSSANFITISTDARYHQFSEELRAEGNWNTGIGKIAGVIGAYYYSSGFNRGWFTGGDFWNTIESFSGIGLANNVWFNPALAAATGFADPVSACLAPRNTPALKAVFGQVACDPGYVGPYGAGTLQKLYETQDTKSVALFGHADWEFYPKFTLTAGVRWTHEKKSFVGYQSYLAPLARKDVFAFPGSTGTLTKSGDQVTPTVGLAYQATHDVLVYGSFSEGWHSGGFFGVNQNISDFSKTYEPETSQSFEVGAKTQFFDHRVQFNVAGFLNNFHNKQESAIALDATTNTVVTVFNNVAGVRYIGFEGELQWVVTQQLRLAGTFGYLHSKYTDLNIAFPNAVNGNVPNPNAHPTFLVPRNAPKWTLGGQATYTVPVGPGNFEVGTKVTWVDDIQGGIYNESYAVVKAHTDVAASASYSYENYKITVFGRNLTGYVHEQPAYIATLFAAGTIGPGRSWGLEIAAKF